MNTRTPAASKKKRRGILSSLYEDGEDVDSDGESSGSYCYRCQSKSKPQTKRRSGGSVVSNRRRHCPPLQETVDDKDNEKAVDVWDKSWVRDATLDERRKSTIYAGFGLYSSIAEEWERQRQLDRPVDNGNSLWCRLYCDLCSRPKVEQWRSEFQTVNMSIGFGIPLIGMILISLLDLLI